MITGIDTILFDVGGTLVAEAPAATPVGELIAEPLPGVVDALRALAPHYRLGAVTDTAVMDGAAVRALLAPVGLDALLEIVVTSSDVGASKPDPRVVHEALRRLGADASRSLLIGDRDVDRDAAAVAGVAFVATDAGLVDALARASLLRAGAFGDAASRVAPVDEGRRAEAFARHEQLTKPSGSLGRLEALGARLAAITASCPPPIPTRPAVVVFAGDHGVVASGVTPWPQEVTAQMVSNFASGGAAINVIARYTGASVHVVDVGVGSDITHLTGIRHHKVLSATADLSRGPAMSTADACDALDVGARVASELVASGHDLLVTGEMGIGNTTAAAALVACFTSADPATVTGRGTGIDDTMLAHKQEIVAGASARASRWLDPVSVLAEVGGLEIAALAGFIVGGAAARVPVVVDGLITCAALLVAEALVPRVRDRCIAGHRSVEPGASATLSYLGLDPLLDLDLRLGEGTGGCLAIPLVLCAAAVLSEMATFADLG